MDESVTLTCRDGVADLVLDRPEARNALNLAMCLSLQRHFAALDADPAINVVLLSARGPGFCAGADVKERKGRDAAWIRQRRLAAYAAYAAIAACSRPVVTLVHGSVIGSGGEIALSGDLIIAADDTVFSFPEPQLGTVGATQRLQRAIGAQRARDMLLTGRSMAADEALAAGLVARVIPRADLLAQGRSIARRIADAPPQAIRLTKRTMDLGRETDLATAIRIELAAVEQALASGGGTLSQTSSNPDEN